PPATSVQRRMYVIQQGNPRSTSYNLPLLYAVEGEVTADAIARACAALVDRHESLRTAFFFQAGEILQKVSTPKFSLERIELASLDDVHTAAAAFVRPFRLEAPPLFRAAVLTHAGRVAFVALDMHHIIADGTSIDVMLEDVVTLLAGSTPVAPALRYIDYAVWVASPAGAAQLAAGKAYWTGLLHDELPVLELPYDFRRPLSRQQSAGELTIELPQATIDAIATFARAREATPFAFYSAAYAVFLSCVTGSPDVVFGYPSAGRPNPDFERTVGMFVNSLPFRARIDADDTFDDLVRQAMRQIRESLRAEDYPFEDMVADLRLPATPGRNPIFDTMLSYEGARPDAFRVGTTTLREIRLPQRHARMDLVATIRETAGAGATLRLEYSTDLFKRSTVERFARELVGIIARVLAATIKLEDLHTVDVVERDTLLHTFNTTTHDLPAVHSVHELFEQHVDATPDAIAVEMWDMAWTYAEVERRANTLGHALRDKGMGRDALVAIQLDPCPEMLVAVLGVLKAGAAFLPIDPEYPLARKQYMLKDSGARVLLTRGALSADVAAGLDVIDLAQPMPGRSDRVVVEIERSDLAYVIYTSGSTGLPKGTLIEHRGLVNFAAWYADYFAIRPGDGVAKYAGFGFDASISELVPCFISGARLVIVPAELRLAVQELDAYFAEHRVAIAFLPTQFGEQFLRAATRHTLRAAFLGGEKLRNRPSDRLAIINGYGPTEYTVAATAFTVDRAYDNIPIGKPLWNTQILVLDRLDRLCPIGVAGELCISGTSIARGYLNRAELTAEKFVTHPFDPTRRMYRTGDLARWLEDGNLEFLGRIDTQVKVRGFRVELGEIEQALLALPSVNGAVVVARENPAVAGDVSLIAFVTATAFDEPAVKTELGRTLPAYMVPARIVVLPEIPLTANGKVDKRRLPEVELEALEIVAPRDAVETELRELFADVLGRPAATISIHTSFLELGGHSLKAAVLLSALYQRRGIQLRFAQFLAASSVAELAAVIANETRHDSPVWEHAPDGPLALTSSQLRMYAVNQLSTWSTAYNIPFAWELAPELDVDKLVAALQALVPRHHALRAGFVERAGAVVQEFGDAPLVVGRMQIEDASLRATLERFVRPFDLAVAPLVRAAIVTTESRRVLALDVHHIVADGLSVRLLLEDLEALYQGTAEPLAGPTFADYAFWETGPGGAAQRDAERAWWLERFNETPSPLELPVDFDRPPRLSFDGDEVALELPAETGTPLVELAKARGITPLGVFLGAYAVLLSRLGNTTDVVIGVPAAGRQRAGMERMVGMFVNTIPLRIRLRADEPFSELCVRVGTEATEAFERQTYQLNDLVADLGLARDPSRNPLFDVLFAWEEAELVELDSSLGLRELPQAQAPSKFDLELTVQNTGAGQKISLLFAKKLFKRATAERFIGNFRKLLEQVARTPDAKIRELRMLQPWERELLLAEFNDTEVRVQPATMADLFARHVAERPDAIACEDAHGTYTFAEIDRRASALATALIARGVIPDDVVALAMLRSRELLVGMVGIWKAGAGYLPIEPDA
ncbi:MAG TPA: amino acid adenylation domain-containing protein, partial [Kofleriaceae bacterium]